MESVNGDHKKSSQALSYLIRMLANLLFGENNYIVIYKLSYVVISYVET
jgi:hypothetical protein